MFTRGRLSLRDTIKNAHVCVYEFPTELSIRLLVRHFPTSSKVGSNRSNRSFAISRPLGKARLPPDLNLRAPGHRLAYFRLSLLKTPKAWKSLVIYFAWP
jgi:hypothetical protein